MVTTPKGKKTPKNAEKGNEILFRLSHYVSAECGSRQKSETTVEEVKIYLIHSGKLKFSLANTVYQPMTLVIVNPELKYTMNFLETTEYSCLSIDKALFKQITFSEFFYVANKFFIEYDQRLRACALFNEDYSQINNIFIMLNENFCSYNTGLLEKFTSAQLLLLINKLLINQEAVEFVKNRKQKKFSLSERVATFINENLMGEISLQDICDEFGYSKYHISHVFKNDLGVSVGSYIVSKKVLLSQKYLLETEKTISDIASDLYFSSPSYFCVSFKNILGYSPSEYRKMAKGVIKN